MSRKSVLMIAALVSLYLLAKRKSAEARRKAADEHRADAQWANEGGGNAPSTV